ncbi:MAG TPA: ATP-binding protein [Acidimicrobiales bacterium]|nr:ATP-binding protein [Acidimicrobiales bacterium]
MTLRLLVVDDNPDYRLLVRFALADSAVDVVGEEGTVESAIAAAAALQPDLILLDVVMQDSDALGSIQPLREAAPAASIVAVASYAEHDLWGTSPHVDGVAYLSKATPPSRLCDELVRIAESAKAASDIVATERCRFPGELQSARAARRFAAEVLASWECDAVEDAVLLLVSELVTNAVIHAHSDVEIVLRLHPRRVRVEVIDAAAEYVHRRDATSDEQSGRGMALTEALASAWGIDTLVAGKSVWFEVAHAPCAAGG